MSKRKQNNHIQGKWILLLVALLLTSGIITAFAKYVTTERRKAEAISAGFFVSSDYLSEDGEVTHNAVNSGSEFTVNVYNYELENTAKISQIPVEFTVDVKNGGVVDPKDKDKYVISANTAASQALTIQATDRDEPVEVTVTTAPFEQTLQAKFILSGDTALESIVDDKGTHCILTIYSNDYSKNVEVTWNEDAYVPDSTNETMKDWENNGFGTFTAEAHTKYELFFLKIADEEANITAKEAE